MAAHPVARVFAWTDVTPAGRPRPYREPRELDDDPDDYPEPPPDDRRRRRSPPDGNPPAPAFPWTSVRPV